VRLRTLPVPGSSAQAGTKEVPETNRLRAACTRAFWGNLHRLTSSPFFLSAVFSSIFPVSVAATRMLIFLIDLESDTTELTGCSIFLRQEKTIKFVLSYYYQQLKILRPDTEDRIQ